MAHYIFNTSEQVLARALFLNLVYLLIYFSAYKVDSIELKFTCM